MHKKVTFSQEAISSAPWLVIGKILSFVIYFIISILIVKCLSAEDYGLFVMGKSLGSYLVILCALGLNTCLLRYIPELVVKKEFKSIERIIRSCLKLQILMLLICGVAFWLLRSQLQKYAPSSVLILLLTIWMGGILWKNLLNDCLTALFKSKAVAIVSVTQSLIWIVLLYSAFLTKSSIEIIFLVEIISNIAVSIGAMFYLNKKVIKNNLNSVHSEDGIDKKRFTKLAAPVLCNGLLRSLMLQYTEVFFLGLYFAPALAGFYELGYSTPLLAITFIPMAVQTLFSSAFAEAYTKDKSCLGSPGNVILTH